MKPEHMHQQLVTRLRKPGTEIMQTITPTKLGLLHMASCICKETGELFGAVKKSVFYNKPLDMTNVMKLDYRYATGKYSDEQAQRRADKLEAEVGGSGHEW